ncbi:MAG: TIGR02266 family protein [Deltaproteobacteria bacterium]|nr:TIGR02266 family protein [Deltaproteobacteria bacterium]
MVDKGSRETRQTTRIPIELRVEYKKMNTFFSDYTKNISKGGTFIKTDKPLKVGTEFLFKLSIPALSDPIDIRGQVVWTNTETVTQRADVPDRGMGIKFIYDDPDSRRKFESMVERLMKDSLGDLVFDNLVGKRGEQR